MLYLSGPYLPLAIKTGIVSGILALTVSCFIYYKWLVIGIVKMWFVINVFMDLQEGIAVGRTFAALKNYQVDGNKEMMAIGLMNMAGSCSSCYVTTGTYLIQCPSQKFKQVHLQKKKRKLTPRDLFLWRYWPVVLAILYVQVRFSLLFYLDKFYFYRILFSISSKLQRWGTNGCFKHNNGNSCVNHPAVSNATVLLHSHCHPGSNHHNSSDWPNRLSGCITVMESWQARFLSLLVFVFWCSFHLSTSRPSHCSKHPLESFTF